MKLDTASPLKPAFALIAVAGLSLVSGNAAAFSVSGAYARAISPAEDTCASYDYGLLTNKCPTATSFIMPLTFRSAGYKDVSFIGYGATSSSTVTCTAVG